VVREELAGVDSRRQASTSRRRFLASRAARVAPPPRDLATVAVARVRSRGVDTGIASDRVGWAGNETAMFFPEPGRNER
jgi:hypothetical protein